MHQPDPEPKVLVVDDEPNIRDLLETALRFHRFDVSTAATGSVARNRLATDTYDIVVLDVKLPDIDGFELCRALRLTGDETPVIFLTARDTPADTVHGLSLGGDDYVTKPFSVETLVARIRAVLRRTARPADDDKNDLDEPMRVADLELSEATWTVRRGETPVELSPTEFRLLAYLMRNAGRVLTRAQLLEEVWGWDYGGQSQIVETYISYLRRKLDPLGPSLIHTQRGVGYSLRTPDPARDSPRDPARP